MGRAMNGATRTFWVAAFVIATGAVAQPALCDEALDGEIRKLEDEADAVAPADQMTLYLKLRQRVLAMEGTDTTAILQRLAAKLRLAEARSATVAPGYAERMSLCKQSAEIGSLHLAEGDPERALAWERTCRSIESDSPYATMLRNQMHEWFEGRLKEILGRAEWLGARELIARWERLLGEGHATREGRLTYARQRTHALRVRFQSAGAPVVLEELVAESRHYPDLPTWDAFRAEVVAGLQAPFERAIAERRAEDARSALDRQLEVRDRFELDEKRLPVESNRSRLAELEKLLAPEPIKRAYGHVLHPAFRLEIVPVTGTTRFEDPSETISGTASNIAIAVLARGRAEDANGWWGGEVSGLSVTAADGLMSGEALVIELNALRGINGRKWSARFGGGLALAQVDYTGTTVAAKGSGVVFGNFAAAVDAALGQSVVVQTGVSFAMSDALSRWSAYAGVAYHANSNFALGLRALAAGVDAEDAEDALHVELAASAVGAYVAVQF
jgi:hypothetical protein